MQKNSTMESNIYTPAQIYDNLVKGGKAKANTDVKRLIFKGIIGGISIAIAAYVTSVAIHDIDNVGISKLIAGVTFPVGLIMILLAGGHLFTSDCFLFINLIDEKVKINQILKVLVAVYLSNFLGAMIIAWLAVYSGQLSMGTVAAYAIKVADVKLSISFTHAIISGVFCNFLVCLAVITQGAAKDVSGKVLCMFFVVMAFAISGVEHCVANMYYLSVGLLASNHPVYMNVQDYNVENFNIISMMTNNLIPVTLGNILGGILFSVLIFYAIRDRKQD